MKVVNCRVAEDIAEALHYEAQSRGMSQYNLIADLLTAHVVDGRKAEETKEDKIDEITSAIKSMQHNIRIIGEVVLALLSAQVGEEEARRLLQQITQPKGA